MNLKSFLSSSLINAFSVFIIAGNLFRLINAGFHFNLLISEFILYFFSFLLFLWYQPFLRSVCIAMLIVLGSALYGTKIAGIHLFSLFQAFRLIAMVIAGVTLGRVLFAKYGMSIQNFQKYLQKIYLINLFFGTLLLVCFPSSSVLWFFLAKFGITIKGDPHIGRFVSMYFDPNYFSAICCIPFIISYLMNRKFTLSLYMFSLGIFLTFSRSGITTFLCVVLFMCWPNLVRLHKIYFKKRSSIIPFYILVTILLVSILLKDHVLFFWNRSINMEADMSAIARLNSFKLGLDFLLEHPILGVGYNFVGTHLSDAYCINSSLLIFILSFGVPLTCLFIILLIAWPINTYFKIKRHGEKGQLIASFFKYMVFYLFVCVIFTCHFNNLLFYPFWFIPILTIFSYLIFCLRSLDRSRDLFEEHDFRIGLQQAKHI